MPAGGLEPPRHPAADFKSAASTVPPGGRRTWRLLSHGRSSARWFQNELRRRRRCLPDVAESRSNSIHQAAPPLGAGLFRHRSGAGVEPTQLGLPDLTGFEDQFGPPKAAQTTERGYAVVKFWSSSRDEGWRTVAKSNRRKPASRAAMAKHDDQRRWLSPKSHPGGRRFEPG